MPFFLVQLRCFWGIVAMLVLASHGLGCSSLIEFDPNGQLCDSGECSDGHSCLVSRCIADQSLALDEDCVKTVQCASEEEGAVGCFGFNCRKTCASFYGLDESCDSGEYCGPFEIPSDAETSERTYAGACLPQDTCEVATNEGCAGGLTCVQLPGEAAVCIQVCNIRFTGSAYDDDCVGTANNPKYCQEIGSTESPIIACLPTSISPQQAGAQCTLFNKPCASGLSCVLDGSGQSGFCRSFCNPDEAVCGAGKTCQARSSDYGLCL